MIEEIGQAQAAEARRARVLEEARMLEAFALRIDEQLEALFGAKTPFALILQGESKALHVARNLKKEAYSEMLTQALRVWAEPPRTPPFNRGTF